MGHGLARVVDDDDRDLRGVGLVQAPLGHDELRAAVDGVLRERMAVDLQAHDAEEQIARLDGVAPVGQTTHFTCGIADYRAIKPNE